MRTTGLAIACALAVSLAACAPEPLPLPSELVGVWKTSSPRYAERSFEVRADWVIFGTGRNTLTMHELARVEPGAGRDGATEEWTPYRIVYRAESGDEQAIEILFRTRGGRALRFAHRDEIWTPAAAAAQEG